MSFADDIAKGIKKYKVGFDDTVTLTLTQLGRAVVKATPVDSGRARNNWAANIGSPNGNGALETAAQQAPGNVWYLTNNLPYIRNLEYGLYPQPGTDKTTGGYSKQAPAGMVRMNIENVPSYIKKAIENLKP